MNLQITKNSHQSGLTLVELILVIGALAVISAIAIQALGRAHHSAHSSKLQQDLATLNQAVKMYQTSGGEIPTNDPKLLIQRMKRAQSGEAASRYVGMTGGFLDPRTALYKVTSETGLKWNEQKSLFELASEGTRYKIRYDNEVAESSGVDQAAQRRRSLVEYSDTGWIWTYDDEAERLQMNPTLVSLDLEADPEDVSQVMLSTPPIEPPLPSLEILSPPFFSIPAGSHDIDLFNLSLELINPNSEGVIVYAIINKPGWEFQTYTSAISIAPGDNVIAYVSANDPYKYQPSSILSSTYKGAYYAKPLQGETDEETPVSLVAFPSGTDPDKIDITFSITGLSTPSGGIVSYNDGTIIFDPANDFQYLGDGQTETVTFTYSTAGTDGGTTQETVTITVTGVNDTPTIDGAAESLVTEAGLSEGTFPDETAITAFGMLTVDDADEGDTLTLNVNGKSLGTIDGKFSTALGPVPGPKGNGEIVVHGDGSWVYTLLDNVQHDNDDSTFTGNEVESFRVTVTDASGGISLPIDLIMNNVDDSISASVPALLSADISINPVMSGPLNLKGADGDPYEPDLRSNVNGWSESTIWTSTNLTSYNGFPLYYQVDPGSPNKLIGYVDKDLDSPSAYGNGANQLLTFILELNPSSDVFTLDTYASIDSRTYISFNLSNLSASGPGPIWIFTDGSNIYNDMALVPSSERKMFTVKGAIAGSEVNKSTNYMGIDNMWVDAREGGIDVDLIVPSFDVDIRLNFSGGSGKGKQNINWVAYGVDDATVVASGTHNGKTDGPILHAEGGVKSIGKLVLRSASASTTNWQVGEIILGSAIGKDPVTVTYDATISDSDGDEVDVQMGFHMITSQY